MKKNIVVKQSGNKECGISCLLSIIRYYGGNISVEKLLELTRTNKEGTTFYNLSIAGKELGLSSIGYKVEEISQLYEYDKPYICQVKLNNIYHFIVVYKIKNNKLTIMDPATGMTCMQIDEFNKIFQGYILTFTVEKNLPNYEEKNYIKNAILELLTNNKKIIINLILLSLFVTIFSSIYSYSFQVMIENVYSDKFNLLVIAIVFINILFLKNITSNIRIKLLLILEEKLDLSIITTTFKRIIFLPYNYYKNKTVGDMTSRINDLFNIKNYITKVIIVLFLDIFMIIASSIILYCINSRMAIILFIVIIIYVILFMIHKNNIKKLTIKNQESSANLNSFIVETINGYETIKGLNVENIFLKKLSLIYLKLVKNNLTLNNLLNNYELLNGLNEGIGISLITLVGCFEVMKDNLTIGTIITFNTLSMFLINPIKDILELYKDYYYIKNSIRRINDILNIHIEKLDSISNLPIEGNIMIRNLNYSYNKKNNIITNLNINISNMEKVLLLGPSGTGKSTLLKLIYKYYQIERNKIFINNYDINDFKLLDIRKNIAYISQQEVLYTDTIRNNIVIERNITEEEFLLVTKITRVDKILENKNIDYDFLLEENGSNISGGERQRIILARTLLKNSSIVLIDEGLNEIDTVLEKEILEDIFKYYKEKTFIVVSHRKENISIYDRVINIKEAMSNG